MKQWIPFVLVCAFAAGNLLTELDHVGMQWDESYYVTAAKQFHDGIWIDPCWDENDELYPRPVNYEHPPLAKLIIGGSTQLAGDTGGFEGCRSDENQSYTDFLAAQSEADRSSWRWPAALLSFVGLVCASLAAGRLFGGALPATIAAGALSLDLLYIGQARVAILDPFAAAFLAMSLYAATFTSWKGTLATIVLLSLGFASKYTAAFAGPPLLLLHLYLIHQAGGLRRRRFDATLASFAIVPVLILALSYIPWWIIWIQEFGAGAVVHWVKILGTAISWGTTGDAPHADASGPWSWLLVAKPVWYYTQHHIQGDPNQEWYIYAIANPFLMWVGCLSAVYGISLFKKDRLASIVALLPIATFAVFLFIDRATFIFYAVVLSPLFALTIAQMGTRMWRSGIIWQRLLLFSMAAIVWAGYDWYSPLIYGDTMTLGEKEALFEILPWIDP